MYHIFEIVRYQNLNTIINVTINTVSNNIATLTNLNDLDLRLISPDFIFG